MQDTHTRPTTPEQKQLQHLMHKQSKQVPTPKLLVLLLIFAGQALTMSHLTDLTLLVRGMLCSMHFVEGYVVKSKALLTLPMVSLVMMGATACLPCLCCCLADCIKQHRHTHAEQHFACTSIRQSSFQMALSYTTVPSMKESCMPPHAGTLAHVLLSVLMQTWPFSLEPALHSHTDGSVHAELI